MINADRTHINRLFTNLILNAMQAVPADRNVQINIDEEMKGNTVLIKVKDNGNGINEEVQSKIFTPNFTTKTSGTGLGLAMSKGIVEQAKGKIWFETGRSGHYVFCGTAGGAIEKKFLCFIFFTIGIIQFKFMF